MASSKTSRTIEIISFLIAIASFAEASIIIRSNHTGSDKMQMLGIVTPTPARCYWNENGTFVQMEVTSCTVQACIMTVGSTYYISPTFWPAHNTISMKYRLRFIYGSVSSMATYDFGTKTYTDSFYGGNSYKLVEPVTIPAALRGKTGQFEVRYYDQISTHINRCFAGLIEN
ncbi:uncharacterized protein LOC110856026 [Folsomia candida]|uniref:Uncharacterized protein n=1 Tax=Folsomia candida TaxID=158441 RepID=A0A226DR51_FOLCA|nr:uncharacterized protein LOC110856026 [Folsomia candida]XP_035712594.1 uncharacterized protein LOC110856026 [Folsomia candida]OXA47147.1 hypothetical protein Fcan01_18313 [Folsomia candida]